jgi:hypothetical protein
MAQPMNQTCIDACNACADACDHCSTACLQEQDVKMMARCIALDIDCAALCRLAAGAMARGSELTRRICGLCALVCRTCSLIPSRPPCGAAARATMSILEACRRESRVPEQTLSVPFPASREPAPGSLKFWSD